MLTHLVIGYLADLDRHPTEAASAGLDQRLALVFTTYDPERGEMMVPADAVVTALDCIGRHLPHDARTASFRGGALDDPTDDGLAARLAEDPAALRIRFDRGGACCGYLSVRDFMPIGGPDPYHDAVVLELHHAEPSIAPLVAELQDRLGPVAVSRGGEQPARTLRGRLRALFGG